LSVTKDVAATAAPRMRARREGRGGVLCLLIKLELIKMHRTPPHKF